MKATIVDLRYKMNDVLKALDRKEEVTILYRGKVKGRLVPVSDNTGMKVKDHPLFGINRDRKEPVLDEMNRIREERTHDI